MSFASYGGDRVSIPGSDRPVIKTGSDSFIASALQQVWMSRVLRDDHYKQIICITVGVARYRTLNAQWPHVLSTGLKPLTSNSDVFIWVKNSQKHDIKPEINKQPNSCSLTCKVFLLKVAVIELLMTSLANLWNKVFRNMHEIPLRLLLINHMIQTSYLYTQRHTETSVF